MRWQDLFILILVVAQRSRSLKESKTSVEVNLSPAKGACRAPTLLNPLLLTLTAHYQVIARREDDISDVFETNDAAWGGRDLPTVAISIIESLILLSVKLQDLTSLEKLGFVPSSVKLFESNGAYYSQ